MKVRELIQLLENIKSDKRNLEIYYRGMWGSRQPIEKVEVEISHLYKNEGEEFIIIIG